jgi:hypothetical protein
MNGLKMIDLRHPNSLRYSMALGCFIYMSIGWSGTSLESFPRTTESCIKIDKKNQFQLRVTRWVTTFTTTQMLLSTSIDREHLR